MGRPKSRSQFSAVRSSHKPRSSCAPPPPRAACGRPHAPSCRAFRAPPTSVPGSDEGTRFLTSDIAAAAGVSGEVTKGWLPGHPKLRSNRNICAEVLINWKFAQT